MTKTRFATALVALLLAAGFAAPGHAESDPGEAGRGGGYLEPLKSPRKKERETRTPTNPGTPDTKPESGKIVFF